MFYTFSDGTLRVVFRTAFQFRLARKKKTVATANHSLKSKKSILQATTFDLTS